MEQEIKDMIAFEPGLPQLTSESAEWIATVIQQKRDLERAEKMIKERLMGIMGANGYMKAESETMIATVVTPETKPHEEFNLEALKRDFPEIAEAYTHTVEGEPKAPYIKITVR